MAMGMGMPATPNRNCSRRFDKVTAHFLPRLGEAEFGRMVADTAWVVDTFRKHGIDVLPIGGTFVGALRHGGLIPWDDNVGFYYAEFPATNPGLIMAHGLGRLSRRSAYYRISRAIVPMAHDAGIDVVQSWRRGEFDFGSVKLIPWADDGSSLLFRHRTDDTFALPRDVAYPIAAAPFHGFELPMFANPAVAWQRVGRLDQRGMVDATMNLNDSLNDTINNMVLEHMHFEAGARAPLKVSPKRVAYLQAYDPARWRQTLPWDCCCGAVSLD